MAGRGARTFWLSRWLYGLSLALAACLVSASGIVIWKAAAALWLVARLRRRPCRSAEVRRSLPAAASWAVSGLVTGGAGVLRGAGGGGGGGVGEGAGVGVGATGVTGVLGGFDCATAGATTTRVDAVAVRPSALVTVSATVYVPATA